MADVAEQAGHRLLLVLAGRLADGQLWRFRDWLASGAVRALARVLPRTLLHDRIAITDAERALLTEAFQPAGADPELISAVPWLGELAQPRYVFSAEPPDAVAMGDSSATVLSAALRWRPEIDQVRSCWRQDDGASGPSKRIVLVSATAEHARLVGELQRMLRALGDYEPCVEALPPGMEWAPYHREAWMASELVCTGAAAALGQPQSN